MKRLSRKIREAFSGRSSSAYYYPTKGHAINSFDGILQGFDLCLDRENLIDFNGDEGRKAVDIHDEYGACVGHAVFTWYRLPSGRYEFIGYIT